jgi:hypothetical protein
MILHMTMENVNAPPILHLQGKTLITSMNYNFIKVIQDKDRSS